MDRTTRTSQRLVAITTASGKNVRPDEMVAAQAVKPLGMMPLIASLVGLIVGVLGVMLFSASKSLALLLMNSFGGVSDMHGVNAEEGIGGWLGALMHVIPGSSGDLQLWVLIVLPAIGGLLIGLYRKKYNDHEGAGPDLVVHAFHHQRGHLRKRLIPSRLAGSVITLGSGGSGGREGPIALIGAAIGSWVAEKFHLTVRERRILLAAGIAAGVGGMFRAPLAGGLMAAEIFYSDSEFEPDVMVPSMLASVTSYCVFCLCFGWDPLFAVVARDYQFDNPGQLIPLFFLSIAVVGMGFVYVGLRYVVEKLFKPIPMPWRPMIGAGSAGVITVGLLMLLGGHVELQGLMGDGYGVLQLLLAGKGAWLTDGLWWLLIVLAIGKLITSLLTSSTGGVAGMFGPAMVVGGCVGGLMGLVMLTIMPAGLMPSVAVSEPQQIAQTVGIFSLVGMAGFYAAVARAPISTVIIVSELTGSYHLLLPSLWVVTICFIAGWRLRMYKSQVGNRKHSPAHRGDLHVNVLRDIKVKEILPELQNFETVHVGTPLRAILAMQTTRQSYFPVVTRDGVFCGIFSLNDLRSVLDQQDVWELLVAADIARMDVVTVHPSETLAEVAAKFAELPLEELPVVADDDEGALLGIISRRQLNNAYIKRMMVYDQAERTERTRIMQGEMASD